MATSKGKPELPSSGADAVTCGNSAIFRPLSGRHSTNQRPVAFRRSLARTLALFAIRNKIRRRLSVRAVTRRCDRNPRRALVLAWNRFGDGALRGPTVTRVGRKRSRPAPDPSTFVSGQLRLASLARLKAGVYQKTTALRVTPPSVFKTEALPAATRSSCLTFQFQLPAARLSALEPPAVLPRCCTQPRRWRRLSSTWLAVHQRSC